MNCYDERRGRSRGTFGGCGVGFLEERVIVWKDHSEQENQDHIEEQDPVECESDGTRNDLARILGLSNRYTDQFDAEICKDCCGQNGPESEETPGIIVSCDVPIKSSGILPISKALWIMVRAATTSKNQTEQNETEDHDDLDTGKPELELSKELDTKVIDEDDCDEEDCDEGPRIDLFTGNPVLEDEGSSCQVVWCNDNILRKVRSWLEKSSSRGRGKPVYDKP